MAPRHGPARSAGRRTVELRQMWAGRRRPPGSRSVSGPVAVELSGLRRHCVMTTASHLSARVTGAPAPAGRETPAADPYDFSLVLGGPLFQIVRRAHLSGGALELLRRRVVAIALFVWLPLLALSALDGRAWGTLVDVPFLKDIEAHLRFLLALPLLIAAELVIHQRMRPVVRQFLERDLIPDASRAKFDAAVSSAMRLRNSVTAEVVLIVFVYAFSILYTWPTYAALRVPTWYATPSDGAMTLTAAGWWLVCVSLPAFQFILFRWYFRLFIWMRF